jgi:hypothetical protein
MCVNTYTQIYLPTRVFIRIYISIHVCLYLYIYIYISIHVCLYIYIPIHVSLYIYIYTYTGLYFHTRVFNSELRRIRHVPQLSERKCHVTAQVITENLLYSQIRR